ncbi:MAG: flagellar M-ring protein FliF C-terminal domain-containing protein, partial [Opitutaceae bacterium]
QKGHVLSADLKDDPTLGAATSQMRYRQQVEDYFARKVESLLTPVIGPGNAVVRVSADIDSETANRSEERFDPEGQVVRSQTNIEETSTSVEKKKSGVAGVTSNTPDAAKDEAPLVANDQNTKNRTTSYEINRVLTNTSRTPGTIRGLSASVFVAQRMVGIGADAKPQPRTAEELQGLRKLVINAIGLKAFAGANANANVEDLVTIQEAAFQSSFPAASADDVAVPTKVRTWIELGAKYLPVLIAVLAFGFFFRLLRTQRPETVPMEVINPPREEEQSELPAVVTAATLNELLRKKPANIGAALRGWTAEAKS